jgi:anti-anti-sigma regulatory factor
MGDHGKVAHICGARLTHRQTEFHKLLDRHPGIVLAYEGSGDWTRESGATLIRAALADHPDLRGVFAHNDLMAMGAIDVIAEMGLSEQIIVVGFDADPDGLIGIHEGQLAATVYRSLYGVGRAAVDAALRIIQNEQVPPEIRIPVKLITAKNLLEATLDTTYILPGLLRDLVESSRAQRRLQQETITAQRNLIQELSTPIIPISESILIMPLIGVIDNARAQQIMESLLVAISQRGAEYMLIDITGMAMVDTAIAHHLMQAARAVQLLGAQVILVGIRPEVAQTLVALDADFSAIVTRASLQTGFEYAQQQLASAGRSNGSRAGIKR